MFWETYPGKIEHRHPEMTPYFLKGGTDTFSKASFTFGLNVLRAAQFYTKQKSLKQVGPSFFSSENPSFTTFVVKMVYPKNPQGPSNGRANETVLRRGVLGSSK